MSLNTSTALPPELKQASEHLDHAARLVSAATTKYLEGRGVRRTAVQQMSSVLTHIEDASLEIGRVREIHMGIDAEPTHVAAPSDSARAIELQPGMR